MIKIVGVIFLAVVACHGLFSDAILKNEEEKLFIEFVVKGIIAKEIKVIGNFNGWKIIDGLILKKDSQNNWVAKLPVIESDEILYTLIVDGDYFEETSSPEFVPNGFGGYLGFVDVARILGKQKDYLKRISAQNDTTVLEKKMPLDLANLQISIGPFMINLERKDFQALGQSREFLIRIMSSFRPEPNSSVENTILSSTKKDLKAFFLKIEVLDMNGTPVGLLEGETIDISLNSYYFNAVNVFLYRAIVDKNGFLDLLPERKKWADFLLDKRDLNMVSAKINQLGWICVTNRMFD